MNPAMADKQNQPSFYQKYRLPIMLGILAVSLYAFSILYIVFGKGQLA